MKRHCRQCKYRRKYHDDELGAIWIVCEAYQPEQHWMCDRMRESDMPCGPEGELFEPKEVKP